MKYTRWPSWLIGAQGRSFQIIRQLARHCWPGNNWCTILAFLLFAFVRPLRSMTKQAVLELDTPKKITGLTYPRPHDHSSA